MVDSEQPIRADAASSDTFSSLSFYALCSEEDRRGIYRQVAANTFLCVNSRLIYFIAKWFKMLRTKFQKKFVFEKIIMLSNYSVNFKKIFRMWEQQLKMQSLMIQNVRDSKQFSI